MYFPDVSFIPFLRSIDEVVKGIMNKSRFEQDGSDIIKPSHNQILSYQVLLLQVAHEKVKEQADFIIFLPKNLRGAITKHQHYK